MAEKTYHQRSTSAEVKVDELPKYSKDIVQYTGELTLLRTSKSKYNKYRRLTEKQVSAANNAICREKSKKLSKRAEH